MASALNVDSVTTSNLQILHAEDTDPAWWRSAVIYQVYPKSFADSNGDGVGDLAGITSKLQSLAQLGVDAIWLSPFYTSPQRDGGYDVTDYCDVDPMFGDLQDFDNMVAYADQLGIKVIIDLVPNHCSNENVHFRAALEAEPGSPERDMFIFRDGQGENGSEPPNNWQSHFEGSAWTRTFDKDGNPGQWYLHLFDSSQPDWNWSNPAVHAEFERILRFWLDRGASGFRVDVAHALVKKNGLPAWGGRADGNDSDGFPGHLAPMFGQPEIHDIYRSWKRILNEYPGERVLCAEANVDLNRVADWVRKDEMQQAFNFPFLHAGWNASKVREVVTDSLAAFDKVGAPTTWVLSNHDVVRAASRFGLKQVGDGIGPNDVQPDEVVGLRRARAAFLMMAALPGGVYLYQGEELGLPDNTMIEPQYRQDPSFFRSGGERIGRDGCRVPLPWTEDAESAHGFSTTGASWLPQPESWSELSRQAQEVDRDSTLSLYKSALSLRKAKKLGSGSFAWVDGYSSDSVVAYVNGDTLVITNMSDDFVEVPRLPILEISDPYALVDGYSANEDQGSLAPNCTVWFQIV